jgi:sulfatase maturation enzyme AslB (radical SAM superfamily)
MKINSISIVPQEVGCNAKCKYCIAHLTKAVRKGRKKPGIILPKLEKCLKFAKEGGAQTAIITSHGETLLGS